LHEAALMRKLLDI